MAPHVRCGADEFALNQFNDAQPGMLEVCDEPDLISLIRSAVAMGLLTGKFGRDSILPVDDIRGGGAARMTWFVDGKPIPELLDRLDAVREVLTSEGRMLAQGVLAWMWGRSDRTVPISGHHRVDQVEGLAGARALGPLTPNQTTEVAGLLGVEPTVA